VKPFRQSIHSLPQSSYLFQDRRKKWGLSSVITGDFGLEYAKVEVHFHAINSGKTQGGDPCPPAARKARLTQEDFFRKTSAKKAKNQKAFWL